MELNYHKSVLETGIKQLQAMAIYKKTIDKKIPSYGQYENVKNSICFEKESRRRVL